MEPNPDHTKPQPLIGPDLTNNPTGKILPVEVGESAAVICLFFPYDTVNPVTITAAMDDAGVRMNRYSCRFDPETPNTAGGRRMDSKFIRAKYQRYVEKAEASYIGMDLKSYILLRVGEASKYGKKGKLPPDQRPPGESRRSDRERKKKVRGPKYTQKKKRKKK